MKQEKQRAVEAINAKAGLIHDVADQVWDFAELSLQEEKSAALYCEVLEKEGFTVELSLIHILRRSWNGWTAEGSASWWTPQRSCF